MPLFIRDDSVDALATELQRVTRARSKTEAVRIALQHELERTRRARPLRERIAAAMAIADTLGPGDLSPVLLSGAKNAVDGFLHGLGAEEIPISAEIGTLALDAAMRYSKATGYAAKLNFGDCFAYACAKSLGTKLAYKGNDFAHTDLA